MVLLLGATSCGIGYSLYVRLANPVSRQALGKPLSEHSGAVNVVAFSLDGTRLATASDDSTVRLWNISSSGSATTAIGSPLTGHTGGIKTMAFSPDGTILSTGGKDDTIRLWDVADPANPRPLGGPLVGHDDDVVSVVFAPGGTTLVSGSRDSTIRLWDSSDPANPKPMTRLDTTYPVTALAVSPGGLLAAASDSTTVQLWNLAALQGSFPLATRHGTVRTLAFSPDGARLAIAGTDGGVSIWDVADLAGTADSFEPSGDAVVAVAFSPDGRTLAAACGNEVQLWDVSGPYPYVVERLTGHRDDVVSVAFSLDSSTAATGSLDDTARLWNVSR